VGIPRRAIHASCESPWHSLAKHCILDTCFLLTAPFRGMLLTPQGGPRCLAPTAHQIPVYLMVFSTFLCRAFTAQYLYTLRCNHIPPSCFTAQPTLGLLCPIRLFLRALAFRWGLPYLLPARLPIPPEVSRVHYRGLKQDDVGGALSTVPSALCGSPDVAWSRSRLIHALFHWAYGVTRCRAYFCKTYSFC